MILKLYAFLSFRTQSEQNRNNELYYAEQVARQEMPAKTEAQNPGRKPGKRAGTFSGCIQYAHALFITHPYR